MAKVLVCISNSIYDKGYKIACFYDQFLNSLVESGNEVTVFIPNMFNESPFFSNNELKTNINEDKLRQDIKKFSPQLVITFNYATYDRLLECVDCPIVIWDADLLPFWNQVDFIKQNLDRYTFFCFSEFGRNYIHEQLKISLDKTYLVENATNLQREEREKRTNISFIGTYFGTNKIVSDYIKKHSGESSLQRVLEIIKKNPFVSKKDLELIAEEDFKEIPEKSYTSFFSSEDRVNTLNAVSDLGLELYGDEGWLNLAEILPSLTARFVNKKLYTAKHNQDLYNHSKICININHSQSVHGMPWRVFDIMATGGCLISSFSSAIKNRLKKYVDIPMFENHYEARELCQKLLKDDVWRKEIVAASNEYVDTYARWPMRFKQIEEIFGISLCNSSEKGKLTILEPQIKSTLKILNCRFNVFRVSPKLGTPTKKIVIKIWPRTYLKIEKNK